jgi:hypothetical protein
MRRIQGDENCENQSFTDNYLLDIEHCDRKWGKGVEE